MSETEIETENFIKFVEMNYDFKLHDLNKIQYDKIQWMYKSPKYGDRKIYISLYSVIKTCVNKNLESLRKIAEKYDLKGDIKTINKERKFIKYAILELENNPPNNMKLININFNLKERELILIWWFLPDDIKREYLFNYWKKYSILTTKLIYKLLDYLSKEYHIF